MENCSYKFSVPLRCKSTAQECIFKETGGHFLKHNQEKEHPDLPVSKGGLEPNAFKCQLANREGLKGVDQPPPKYPLLLPISSSQYLKKLNSICCKGIEFNFFPLL